RRRRSDPQGEHRRDRTRPPGQGTRQEVTSGRGSRFGAILVFALRRLEAQRLDLAALVRAAGRADAVRALRRPTLGARVDARRLEGVRGAPLVATGLRGFP